ncbi:MAG: HAD-IB family hydrolase [Ginsengibacter sp.]
MLKQTNKAGSLVLIDFDGTITNKDSFLDFILFSSTIPKLVLRSIFALPFFIAYKLKLMESDPAKEKIFSTFFKNIPEKDLIVAGEQYCRKKLKKILRKNAIATLRDHQQLAHTICIVTASAGYWVKPWCDENNYQLICTGYQTQSGKMTGRYDGNNCRGVEKVNKIKEKYNLTDFTEIYCYGDTKDDLPMLKLGTKKYYQFFKL